MKGLLIAVTSALLAFGPFAPTAEATGYTTSGQEAGSERCSGGDALLDPGAAGVLSAGEDDWYSVVSDDPVMLRLRTTSTQFHTGIVDMRVFGWDPDATGNELECRPGSQATHYATNSPFGDNPILGPGWPVAWAELGPFPPGRYQVQVHAWASHPAVAGYALTSTPV